MSHRLPIRTMIGASLVALLPADTSLAQTDMNAMMRNTAANELGVLEYCQAHGHADGSAVAAQRTVISRLPAGTASTGDAEATGRQGVLLGANGQNVPLSQMASRGNTTEADLCTRMASSVKQSVNTNPAMTMPGGMPAMPSMPAGMPSMPNGMPSMPGMPSTTSH